MGSDSMEKVPADIPVIEGGLAAIKAVTSLKGFPDQSQPESIGEIKSWFAGK